jgi:hypothetical protein
LHAISKARNTNMKKLIAFYAITGLLLLLAEAAAGDRMERIDLAGFTCKQFLEIDS